jgi:adenylyl cyclase-associated protein
MTTIWNSMRDMIQLASQCRKPSPTTNLQQETLAPYLESIQNAMKEIRQLKLDRSYDWHIKAVMEMLVCVSWVIMTAPPAPSSFVKDTLGATEFWTNKIRKEYKLKPEKEIMQVQIDFCDAIKGLILDLSSYVKEYHLSGLMWNPNGMDVADYIVKKVEQEGVGVKVGEGKSVASTSTTTKTTTKATTTTCSTSSSSSSSSSSMQAVDCRKELAAKRSSDGNSAATGLRKVSREQQTWRKEYKATAAGGGGGAATTTTTSVKPSMVKAAQKKQVEEDKIKYNLPTCQFQAVGNKWIVEYQTRDSQPSGVCTVEIQNPKEQVYM